MGRLQVAVDPGGQLLVVLHHLAELTLGVNKEPPHKSHGGLEGLALLGRAAIVVVEVGAAEDELYNLVVEGVQRLDGFLKLDILSTEGP